MHSEFYTVTQEAADKINDDDAKTAERIIAVGTTSTTYTGICRRQKMVSVKACSGWTQISSFIRDISLRLLTA